jgi:hypothetical protein
MPKGRSRDQILADLARLDNELDARLREAQTRVEEAAQAYEEAKQVRAAVIEEAVASSWSMGRVGKSLGVTRQRVAQLRNEAS